jgi:peptidoglycan/xylan/chitin deacetylase (PgdA/CDA1 family)
MSPPNFPDGKKYAICLTFDFDAISGWLEMGLASPAYLSRGEFAATVGAPRVLEIMNKYGIKTTWFVPGHTADTFPEVTSEIAKSGHEIAHHGYLHLSTTNLSQDEERTELRRGINAIECVTGKKPEGYRSPSWEFSKNTLNLLLESDFKYDSSLMGDDYHPYFLRLGDHIEEDGRITFGRSINVIEFPISWSLDDWPHFEFFYLKGTVFPGLKSIQDVLGNWMSDFDFMRSHLDWGVLTITFHPEVIGRGHRMIMLEHLIKYFQQSDEIFFTRMIDLVKYFRPALLKD